MQDAYKRYFGLEIEPRSRIKELFFEKPDFQNGFQNYARQRALMSIRRPDWLMFPADTVWDKKTISFDRSIDGRLRLVAPKSFSSTRPVDLNGIILWTRSDRSDDTWVVLEGNHRVSQWKFNECPELTASVFIGRSPSQTICENDLATDRTVLPFVEPRMVNYESLYLDDVNPDFV